LIVKNLKVGVYKS